MSMECPLNREYFVFQTATKKVTKPGCPVTFLVNCEIRRKLAESSQKKLGREFARPLKVYPAQGWERGCKKKRWVLKVFVPTGPSNETIFCRAIGFACLKHRGRQPPSHLQALFLDFLLFWIGLFTMHPSIARAFC